MNNNASILSKVAFHVLPRFGIAQFPSECLKLSESSPSTSSPRSLSAPEIADVCRAPDEGDAQTGLFNIPDHLMRKWRKLLPDVGNATSPIQTPEEVSYRDFIQAVLGFLNYKQVEVPETCVFDAVLVPQNSGEFVLDTLVTGEHETGRRSAAGGLIAINLGPSPLVLQFPFIGSHGMISAVDNREREGEIHSIQEGVFSRILITVNPGIGVQLKHWPEILVQCGAAGKGGDTHLLILSPGIG